MTPSSASNGSRLSDRTRAALAGALDPYQRRVVRVPDRRLAAVLIPLFERDGEPWVVLTKRTEDVGTHKGQISFPGGTQDDGDADLWVTAIRETEEELGVERTAITRLGMLDDYPTFSSGFVVTAFVGELVPPATWAFNPYEIEHVIELPLAVLAAEGKVERWERDGIRFPMSIFDVEGHYVWGLTAFILRRFLDLVGPPLGLASPIGDAPVVP